MRRKGFCFCSLENSIVTLFRKSKSNKAYLEAGKLAILHENVRNILNSKAGPFVYEYYKVSLPNVVVYFIKTHVSGSLQRTNKFPKLQNCLVTLVHAEP